MPSRFSPARASTMPAKFSHERSFSMRVGTLPRRSTTFRSGRIQRSCLRRRTLPVPTVAPAGSAENFSRAMKTSAVSSRSSTARTSSPAVMRPGRSLQLCTAMSMPPSSSAFSISFVNNPFTPAPVSRTSENSERRSPEVVIIFTSICKSGNAPSSAVLRSSTCASASALPRVPRMSGRFTAGEPRIAFVCRAAHRVWRCRPQAIPKTRARAARSSARTRRVPCGGCPSTAR